MKKKDQGINLKGIWIFFLIIILAGCNRNTQKPLPQSKENEPPKLPKVLVELEDEVLKVMYDLDSVTGIEKAIERNQLMKMKEAEDPNKAGMGAEASGGQDGKQQGQSSNSQEKSPEKGKEEKSGEQVNIKEFIAENEIIIPLLDANEVKGSFTKDTSIPENIDEVWTKISNRVTDIHKKWNVLESQLILGKVPQQRAQEFERILDELTLAVFNKEKFQSLDLANELTRVTANFRSYFDGMANHEVYRMYYHIRAVILFAASNDYAKATEHLNEANKIEASLRQDLIKKDSQAVLQKLELSIEDLEKQLVDKNFHLSQIKAPIVIKNIKLIQDIFETEKNKGSGS